MTEQRKARKSAKKAKPAAPRFGARGDRLWAAHYDEVVGERGLVLLEEACRIADRLDKLDACLKGDAAVWSLVLNDRDEVLEVRVDAALVEARQQANVLRQLIVALPLREKADDGDDAGGWVDAVQSEVRDSP